MDTSSNIDTTFFAQVVSFFKSSSYAVLELIIIIVFGLLIIKLLMKLIKQALLVSKIDRSLISFVHTLINFVLLLLLIMYCLNRMSINITGVVALISALGLAIGLALQDLVGGVANGLVIINTKPFKVDDYVEIGKYGGTVREISLLHTILVTPDNKRIVLTNKSVYNSEITNYSAYANRRLELKFGIDYAVPFDKAKGVIRKVVENHPLVLKTPEPFIRMTGEADDALIITVRVWVKSENYWDVNFDLQEQVFDAMNKEGILIPYHQVTVGFRGDDKVLGEMVKAQKGRKASEGKEVR